MWSERVKFHVKASYNPKKPLCIHLEKVGRSRVSVKCGGEGRCDREWSTPVMWCGGGRVEVSSSG